MSDIVLAIAILRCSPYVHELIPAPTTTSSTHHVLVSHAGVGVPVAVIADEDCSI